MNMLLKKHKEEEYKKTFRILYPIPKYRLITKDQFIDAHEQIIKNGITPNMHNITYLFGTTNLKVDPEINVSYTIINPKYISKLKNVFDFSKEPNEKEFKEYTEQNQIHKIEKNKNIGLTVKENNQLVLWPAKTIPRNQIQGFIMKDIYGQYDYFLNHEEIKSDIAIYKNHNYLASIFKLRQ
ncbi:hypothetical protein K9L97_04350 [Candidatus Woesearchaeota archaeon]|nr:hypothetical protein [Candidatus Woesearchaeota archaeon]